MDLSTGAGPAQHGVKTRCFYYCCCYFGTTMCHCWQTAMCVTYEASSMKHANSGRKCNNNTFNENDAASAWLKSHLSTNLEVDILNNSLFKHRVIIQNIYTTGTTSKSQKKMLEDMRLVLRHMGV